MLRSSGALLLLARAAWPNAWPDAELQAHSSSWDLGPPTCSRSDVLLQVPRAQPWPQLLPGRSSGSRQLFQLSSYIFVPVRNGKLGKYYFWLNSILDFEILQSLKCFYFYLWNLNELWILVLGDEGWTCYFACLDFGIFIGPEKNSLSTQVIQGFLSRSR